MSLGPRVAENGTPSGCRSRKPLPDGTCSPAAVIYSTLPARPRGLCWLSLFPQPVQANYKAQGWLRPRTEKAMAFSLGPAVIICLPSVVNPDAGARLYSCSPHPDSAPISDQHAVWSPRTVSPTDSGSSLSGPASLGRSFPVVVIQLTCTISKTFIGCWVSIHSLCVALTTTTTLEMILLLLLLLLWPEHDGRMLVAVNWTEVRPLSFLTATMRGKQLIFLLRQVRKEVLRAETFKGVSPGLGSPLAGGRRGCLTACAARSSFGSAPALPLHH